MALNYNRKYVLNWNLVWQLKYPHTQACSLNIIFIQLHFGASYGLQGYIKRGILMYYLSIFLTVTQRGYSICPDLAYILERAPGNTFSEYYFNNSRFMYS